ncbi:conjugative transfer protein [Escherichia coli]|uniref:IncF plasmid conjugative transfer protein TraN n=1 Tax=Klebsiella pneumoniae TaxID=573 RepID=A0A410J3R4_KLEPN|nr:IncF plasmid conjugative transfer protein TraN [Klebsiella pneumoniae]STS31883.1 conjugative transfer protein [Escherichia coli]
MKRILPLILALVAGMAQADSNSDYRAGSDFARQIQGRVQAVFRALSHRRVSPAITRIRTRQNITVA